VSSLEFWQKELSGLSRIDQYIVGACLRWLLGSEIRIWLEDLTKNGGSYDDELALRNNRTDIESCFSPPLTLWPEAPCWIFRFQWIPIPGDHGQRSHIQKRRSRWKW